MKRALIVVFPLLLGGCQHQTQPQPLAPSAAVAAAESGARVEQQLQAQRKSIDTLDSRLTLLQEQSIKTSQNLAQLQQRAQQQLVALQQLQILLAAKPEPQERADNGALVQLTLMLERLEQISASSAASSGAEEPSGPHYRLASTYTSQGVWVIFKYDEVTGLTWSASDGRWSEVQEGAMLPASRYQVVLRPASQDVKGYVAARIDQLSGDTWWLNGNRWEPFQ